MGAAQYNLKKFITVPIFFMIIISVNASSVCNIRGMNYTGWDKTAYSTDASNQSLDNLKNIGCDWVAINFFYFQDYADSNNIELRYHEYSSDPNSVIHAIQYCHDIGLKVMLKPMVDCINCIDRSYITPSDGWFASYGAIMNEWAEIAEAYNVELFCVGCEYRQTVSWSDEWRQVISGVRDRYNGKLVYAANQQIEEQNIDWWDALDYIGVNPYYPLTSMTDPNEQQLQDAWQQWADDLESWLYANWPDKQIIFTEIGYQSYDGTNMAPWGIQVIDPNLTDFQEQVDCYKALLDQCQDRPWWRGVFWWRWETDPNEGSPSTDYYNNHTPQNKPAETLLNNYYIYCNGFTRGDMNRDSYVDMNDLRMLSMNFLSAEPSMDLSPYPSGDGIINLEDFAVLAQNWHVGFQGDINKDTYVNLEDVILLADKWLWRVPGPCGSIPEDIFEDGYVNLKDFVVIAEKWLTANVR
ncbi:MAG: glycoside hydrolase family 113 [Planctomycetota bacterium]